jgi:hypothetical protein
MKSPSRKLSATAGVFTLACALMAGSLSTTAFADDDDDAKPRSYPYVKGTLSVEIEHDNVFDADDPDAETSDTYNTTELGVGFYFSPMFSVHANLTFEPVLDPGPGEDRFFGDHGLYADELYAKFSFDPLEIMAGKIHPAFGKAWDDTPGLFGTDLAEDYEISERIGVGFSVTREHTPVGKVALHASAFFADTTFLSDSAFTSRGRADQDDGGLSNTESLESFAVSIEGEEVPGFAGLSYNIGFVHQAGGEDDLDDQNGFVLGLKKESSYNNVTFEWVGETAWFDYGGDLYDTGDPTQFVDSLWYWTLGAQATFNEQYRISAAYTARNAELFNGAEFDDYQYTASAGMKVWHDWWLDAGYKFVEEQDEDAHVLGLKLSREIEFERSLSSAVHSLK